MLGFAFDRLPPLARAFTRHVARTRDPYLVPVMLLREEIDTAVDRITDRLFAEVERDLRQAVEEGELSLAEGADEVVFEYDTRLVLPAMLTLGRLHELAGDVPVLRHVRGVDYTLAQEGEATTHEIVRALLDGDMRDAINDDEFEDFETTVRPRKRAAKRAQRTLQAGVEAWFGRPDTPESVRTYYDHAVTLSETHQDEDERFRDLLVRFHDAPNGNRATIAAEMEREYKFATPQETPPLFAAEADLPYFATQYERVGILYEDMLNMYEAALDLSLGEDFKRAIVLMVIAAQVGLDDTDDYPEDRGTQLTPVTAELNLLPPDEAVESLRDVTFTYLDRAEGYASNHLTAMAIAYIREDARDRLDRLEQQVTN
jgi:hypothetical protein